MCVRLLRHIQAKPGTAHCGCLKPPAVKTGKPAQGIESLVFHGPHSLAHPRIRPKQGARTRRTLLEGTAKRPCRKYAKPRPIERVLGRLLH